MKLSSILRAMRIVHGGILGFSLLIVAMAVFLCGDQQGKTVTDVIPLVIALAVISAIELGGAVVLRRKLLPPLFGGEALDLDVTPGEREQKAISRWALAGILSWSLCGAILIHGLILAMLTRDLLHVAPFAIAAVGSLLVFAPSRLKFEATVRGAVK